ncbi:MFS transporter [Actinoplanes sp. GCM10030250]|uniref:MFS transporter n=1 Tax=Actinoplanes sp. GCM10030250 TaxID=3273376 RepID=UPI003609DC54
MDTAVERTTTRSWPAALVLAGAMFLVLFDSLAVATALPAIGAEFAVPPEHLQWVVTLYSLSIGGFLLLGGRVCDLWGRRRLIVASLGVTAAGLLLSGVASATAPLLAGRVLQGLGAAFAIPATLASAATLFPGEPWRSRVFSVVAAAGNTAGVAGAVFGGLITSSLGWRWIFLVVVPVAVLAGVAALLVLPKDEPAAERPRRLDLIGAVLATGGILGVIYGATQLGERGLGPVAVLPVVVGLVLLAALVFRERRVADPLIKPSVVRSRRLVASCVAFLAHCAAYSAVIVVSSLLLQDVHGLSAAQAGLMLAPLLVGSFVSSVPAGPLLRRYGTRRVVTCCLTFSSITLALVAMAGRESLVLVSIALILWGLSSGPVFVALTRECVGDAAPADRGIASALFESTSHIGGAISVAVYLTLVGAGLGYGTAQLVGAAIVGAAVVPTLLIMPK